MRIIFAVIWLLTAAQSAQAFDHFIENDNIRETIIRYEFEKYPQKASLYFVAVYDSKTNKEIDPSDELLRRFVAGSPRIEKASDSKNLKDQANRMVDIKLGAPGMLFSLGGIVRRSENDAEVNVYQAEADNLGGGFKFILKRENARWTVVRVDTNWLP